MTREEIIKEINKIICNNLILCNDADDITEDKIFETDFDADWLDVMEIAIDIEEFFNISFDQEDLNNIKKVKEFYDLVFELVNGEKHETV